MQDKADLMSKVAVRLADIVTAMLDANITPDKYVAMAMIALGAVTLEIEPEKLINYAAREMLLANPAALERYLKKVGPLPVADADQN